MLKRPLLKSPALRQFSTSSSIWLPQRPVTTEGHASEQVSNATPLPRAKLADSLPTESDVTGSTNVNATDSSGSPSINYIELVKQRVQAWTAHADIAIRNGADEFTAATRTTFSQLGSQLNHVTGYEEIEALKRGVVEQEHQIGVVRQAARKAKISYEEAVVQRSNSQREVNDLLQRKSTWTDSDVGRFTSLVRQDHLYEQEEMRAKATVEETDEAVEREFSELMRKILARYHEEQVWSDKIRSASTYGSLAALGLNMLVFIMAILVVEPWKRRRLAQTFERKIEQLSDQNEARLNMTIETIGQQISQQELLLKTLMEDFSRKAESVESTQQLVQDNEEHRQEPELSDIRSWRPSRQQLEVAAVAGAFAIGILSSVVFSR